MSNLRDVTTPASHCPEAMLRQQQRFLPRAFPALQALKSGDESAWTEAFLCLWPVALQAARQPNTGLTQPEAEEAASEALVQLISQIGKVAAFEELKALVVTIAYRRAVSLARRKSAAKRGPLTLSLDGSGGDGEVLPALPALSDNGLSDIDLSEMVLLLDKALSGLDAETRVLLEDKAMQGLSYQEMSAKHRRPVGTLCAKVARGLKKIRGQLKESPGLMKELKAFLR